jgi:hypothetical protein
MSFDALAHHRHTNWHNQALAVLQLPALFIRKRLNLNETNFILLQVGNVSAKLRTQFNALSLVTKTLWIAVVRCETFQSFYLSRVLYITSKRGLTSGRSYWNLKIRITAFLGLIAPVYIFKGRSLLPQVEAPTCYLKRYTFALSLLVNDLSNQSSKLFNSHYN